MESTLLDHPFYIVGNGSRFAGTIYAIASMYMLVDT
jgi:hypothetical protein